MACSIGLKYITAGSPNPPPQFPLVINWANIIGLLASTKFGVLFVNW